MGSGNNRGKLPNTAKNVGEKVVPSVRNEAQSLRTTKETIQPNNKAPGELYYLFFFVMTVPTGRPRKKTGVGNTRNVKRYVWSPSRVLPYIGHHIGMCRPEGYGYGAVLA